MQELFELPLSVSGVYVDQTERKELSERISELLSPIPKGSPLLLQEKNPLNFLFSYGMALAKELVVIALPTDMTAFQSSQLQNDIKGSWLLKNGQLSKGIGKSEIPSNVTHACLTSGTTGKPKLCYFDQEHSRLNARLHCESLGINSNHTLIQTLPLYHSFGLISYYYSWLEKKFILDLNPIFLGLKSLSKRELSSAALHVSPSQLRFMLKEKTDPPKGIDLISIGGGSVDSTSLKDIREKLPTTKIYVTYGLTEAGPRATTGLWNNQEEGYIGKSLEQIQVGVLYNNQIETSGIGKLCLQTPTLKLNPSADEMMGNWLVTRDHVEINAEGEIYFKGREDDLINFGGISLYPSDIETVVRSNPEVHDCVVLKVQSETYEEEPLLVIEPIIDAKEMRTYLKDKLAAGQIPRKIESMEKLPRTSLEKVDRKELSKMLGIE